MPLYEYQCAKCGRFEIIQKFSDALLTVCPTCGQEIQKLLSAPAIQFKGTGWYVTDYARKGGSGSTSGSSGQGDGGKSSDGGSKAPESNKAPESTSSPQNSTSKDSPASGSGSSK